MLLLLLLLLLLVLYTIIAIIIINVIIIIVVSLAATGNCSIFSLAKAYVSVLQQYIILLFLYITEVQEPVLRDPGFINEILLYY